MPSQNSNHFYNWVMGNIDFKFRLYIFLNSRTNWPYDIIFCLNCRIEFTFETACKQEIFWGDLVESKVSIKNYIHTVRSYLKKEEVEESRVLENFRHSENPETFSSSSTGIEFVLIPAGEFEMGSPSKEKNIFDYECPAHKVILKNYFYLGKSSVTQKQWKKIMGKNPSHFKGEDRPVAVSYTHLRAH